MSNDIVTIAPLKRALALAAEAGDIGALKDIAATAAALQKGAKAKGMGIEAENQAAEVILRAERAMGGAIITLKEAGRLYMGGRERDEDAGPKAVAARKRREAKGILPSDERISLADFNVTPNESMNFQRLAGLPEHVFEGVLAQKREEGRRLARMDLLREATPKPTFADPQSRSLVLDAMRSEDPIPVVVKFEKAADALLRHTNTLPEAELRTIAGKVQELVQWYNAQRERHAA